MQAALGLAQLERLDEFVERKRKMGTLYTELFKGVPGLQLPLAKTEYGENIYWVFGIVLDESLGIDAEEAMRRLGEAGVGTRPFFYPMHQQPVLRRMRLFENEGYPVAENMCRFGFYVPSGLALSAKQIERVAKIFREVM